MKTTSSKQLPAAGAKNALSEENAPDNTEHSTGVYINVHEDTSTGLSKQLPAKRVFPFGIYIHWPFCKSKCPYCDFYKEICKDVPQEEIVDTYLEDLEFYHRLTETKTVTSIFFGGGTPSLLEPRLIEKIINRICRLWPTADNLEISLEANPNTDRPDLFANLRRAGINRLSLGIQALNDRDLKFLGRTHNLTQALTAVDKVLRNFDNHSADLIYARPGQNLSDWQQELEQAVNFGFRHISLYQLTIEEGTVFAAKGIRPLGENAAAEMYAFTNDYLNCHGYPQYEVSNYGLPCRHNLLYWQGDDYIGIGKSAHGRFRIGNRIYASTYPRSLEELTPAERAEELVIMGLRLNSGIDKRHFKECCGIDFAAAINQNRLCSLEKDGYLEITEKHIRATPKGFPLLNRLIEELCC